MRRNNRGSALIGTFILLSAFLVYSNVLTTRGLVQQQSADLTRTQYETMNLAQAALEQLRQDLHLQLTAAVFQLQFPGQPNLAFEWLDGLADGTEDPPWTAPHSATTPRCITNLPTVKSTVCAAVGADAQAPPSNARASSKLSGAGRTMGSLPVTPTAIFPPTMKQMPPNIFFSV